MAHTIIIASFRGTITPALGTANISVTNPGSRICLQLLVKSATSTTTFDIAIVDVWGNTIYESIDNTGVHNAFVNIPTTEWGNWTVTISNASVNELFTYLFLFREA